MSGENKMFTPKYAELVLNKNTDIIQYFNDFNTDLMPAVIKPDVSEIEVKPDKEEFFTQHARTTPKLAIWKLPYLNGRMNSLYLKAMTEGKIGKLVVRKSGKMEVWIDSLRFELEPMDLNNLELEVINIDYHRGTMMEFGTLKDGFLLSPDWGYLV